MWSDATASPFSCTATGPAPAWWQGWPLMWCCWQILSQQIWVMQVSGNRKVSEADILSVMEELGVHKGGRMKDLDIQALQIEALQKLPDLVWLTVNPEGAIAHIEVAERQPPPAVIDKSAPSNIKASRDGRIVRMEVYGGQAAVKEGDAVVRGMLLVSGVVDTSVGPVMRKPTPKSLRKPAGLWKSAFP